MPPKKTKKERQKKLDTSLPVFMIVSKDDYEKEVFVGKIVSEHFGDDYCVDNLTLEEDFSYIENVFNVRSLVNANKVIFINYSVKALSKKFTVTKPRKKSFTYEEKLVDLLSNLSDGVLVFLFPDVSDKRKALQKFVSEKFNYVEISEPNDESFKTFILAYSKENGVRLDSAVVKYLMDNVAKDMSLVKGELDKVFLLADCLGTSKLSLPDVKDVVVISSEVVVFDIIDAIAKKDAKTTFSLVDSYMAENSNIFSLIALLQRSFRLLYYAIVYKQSFGEKLHMNAFVAKKYVDRVKLFREREVVKKMMFLLECECELKSGWNPDNAVYEIVLELLK